MKKEKTLSGTKYEFFLKIFSWIPAVPRFLLRRFYFDIKIT